MGHRPATVQLGRQEKELPIMVPRRDEEACKMRALFIPSIIMICVAIIYGVICGIVDDRRLAWQKRMNNEYVTCIQAVLSKGTLADAKIVCGHLKEPK